MKSWCEKIIEELEAKKRDGYILTEAEAESLNYAKGVLISEEVESDYYDGYCDIGGNYYDEF
ncbi:MAG: hypothetical protein KBS91_04190 [Firmicutes bacterium]|nr:hypothetical protein [Candidatus Caballimonas caccae]